MPSHPTAGRRRHNIRRRYADGTPFNGGDTVVTNGGTPPAHPSTAGRRRYQRRDADGTPSDGGTPPAHPSTAVTSSLRLWKYLRQQA